MEITWCSGTYKYRTAMLAYINNIRVAAITTQAGSDDFNASFLLPGLPKATNRFKTSEAARESIEQRVNLWFEQVKQ